VNQALLHPEVQEFIRSYTEEIATLAFKGSSFKDISVQELIQQIEGFRKTEKKLPSWHATDGIYFPPKLNIEQTSSEVTAAYKASLVSGKTLADITGGLGVDTFYFARHFEMVVCFEQNEALSKIAHHNFKALGVQNIEVVAGDGLTGIQNRKFDVIYVDPARRHEAKGKVFLLSDCEPNVIENEAWLRESCEILVIKTSPMLDISAGLNLLKGVAEVHIVAVDNEVKELLWLVGKTPLENVKIATVNFTKAGVESFDFIFGKEWLPSYSLPKQYLYEPNAALMKAGAFSAISETFKLPKLHPNSHLYTSEKLVEFPGRRFRVEKVYSYNKKEMRKNLSGLKANVTTRNFPETVKNFRKKWNIEEGGNTFIFATTTLDNAKAILVCSKIKAENSKD
jgi:16S rRNA G966 N2-methylase RsmD